MKISTKGRYGLRAMIDLAVFAKDDVVSIHSIAVRQDISESYLEQIIAKLKKANLVISIRGAQGGYKLAKNLSDIYIGDILRALEGDIAIVNCNEILGDEGSCAVSDFCVTKYVWQRINNSIIDTIDSISLEEIVKNHHKDNVCNTSECKG